MIEKSKARMSEIREETEKTHTTNSAATSMKTPQFETEADVRVQEVDHNCLGSNLRV